MEFKEFLQKLQSLQLEQTTSEYEEQLPDDIYEIWESFDPQVVESDLDIDKHRWYEISTIAYQFGDNYLGVRGATQMYSEQSSWSDLCVDWEVFEMKTIQITTYEPI